jgi:hypothetical protein
VADILSDHVKLSVEGIDRMYLNVCLLGGICGRFADNSGPRASELRGSSGFLASN